MREGNAALTYEDCYRTNRHQVHSLGYQVTGNDFESGIRWPLSSLTGVADIGHPNVLPGPKGFIPTGYQYLSLRLGSEVGYFKVRFRETPDALTIFYQYNRPRSTRDTLYLRHWDENWRIFYR